ncbi:MAG TPA: hypothetical protein VHC41_10240 [Mycobacteriales bacterium]|jgi:hypothetical protein|nr:hypothetical protein [Mycobacteriales bacterium]
MGLLDTLLGRNKPVKANLDALFGVPSAAITLEAAMGLRPVGAGSVAVKITEGAAFAAAHTEALGLLRFDPQATVTETQDDYGFRWSTVRTGADRVGELVTALHGANTSYAGAGLGPALLCTTVGFAGEVAGTQRSLALVYLYKRGTFYPFAPTGPQQRDSAFELEVRGALGEDLPVEPDLNRWFPVWGAPGLS